MIRWMEIEPCPEVEEAWIEIEAHKAKKAEEKLIRNREKELNTIVFEDV